MKQLTLVILATIFTLSLSGQPLTDSTFTLPTSEKLHYDAYYKLGNIWIKAGLANFSTDTVMADSIKAYRFVVEGYSLRKYDWIFSLEDHYKSVTDFNTLYPIRFEKNNTEQDIWVHTIYHFDKSASEVQMYLESTNSKPVSRTVKHTGFITDALSSLYYLRTWDFNHLTIGDTVRFTTILDGKIFTQPIVYLGRDTLLSINNTKVPMIKLGAVVANSTFFRGDSVPILSPEDEDKFTKVTYNYYEQLNGYEYLKSLDEGIQLNFFPQFYAIGTKHMPL